LTKERSESDDKELERTVNAVYRQLDRTMCENGFEAGSCALVSIFDAVKKEIFVINLGDSRALLFTDECQQLLQTREKSPADQEEKERITNAEHMVKIS
jgi:serine/threonine protein phosphatase PrpC